MSEIERRVYEPDLELRSKGDGRTICGIAVPWNLEQELGPALIEGFRAGAFDHQMDPQASQRVVFSREHIKLGGAPIGKAVLLRNDAKGLYGEFKVARTLAGDETLALFEDGVINHLSVAFQPRQNARQPSLLHRNRQCVWRTKADLREVAMVLEGAYQDNAVAMSVRSKASDDLSLIEGVLAKLPPLPPPPPNY